LCADLLRTVKNVDFRADCPDFADLVGKDPFWSCAREASEKIQVAPEATIKGAMTQNEASSNHFHDNSNGRFVMFRETIIFTGTILA
jgi:hypothetical protein